MMPAVIDSPGQTPPAVAPGSQRQVVGLGDSGASAALQAEQRLIGLLLFEASALQSVGDIVQRDDFFEGPDGLHACIFADIVAAVGKGEPLSVTAIGAKYVETLHVISPGRNYLAELMDLAPPPAEAATLARLIAGYGSQRRIGQALRPGLPLPDIHDLLQQEAKRASTALTRSRIVATPYVWKEPADIEPREWVYGRHYIRKFVSGTLAPGGFGKSTHELVEMIAMASGKPLLGVPVRAPLRVWYWNGEDPLDEIERKVAAICLHFGIGPHDLGDRLHLNSGRDCEIILASETKDGAVMAVPVIDQLLETITEARIDVVALDPFVSCHAVSENDNNKIGAVLKALAGIADKTNCAIDLVHHVKKGGSGASGEVVVADGRGASAFLDRVRSARVLNRMTKEECEMFNLSFEDGEHMDFFRIDHGKANLAKRSTKATWRRMVSVGLGNGREGLKEDKVGVATLWTPEGGSAPRAPALRLTSGQQLIVRAVRLLLDAGQFEPAPPVPGVPAGTEAVRKSELREQAIEIGYAGGAGNPESAKRMFNRDITSLSGREVIRVHGELLWLL